MLSWDEITPMFFSLLPRETNWIRAAIIPLQARIPKCNTRILLTALSNCLEAIRTTWGSEAAGPPCSTQVRHRELGLGSSVEMSPGMSFQPPTIEKWERGRREQRAGIHPCPLGNSVYQFKLSIGLLKVSPTSDWSFVQITDIQN